MLEFGTTDHIITELNNTLANITNRNLLHLLGSILQFFIGREESAIISSCCRCLKAYTNARPEEGDRVLKELAQTEILKNVICSHITNNVDFDIRLQEWKV